MILFIEFSSIVDTLTTSDRSKTAFFETSH